MPATPAPAPPEEEQTVEGGWRWLLLFASSLFGMVVIPRDHDRDSEAQRERAERKRPSL
jgi:hypothetical protein